MASVLLVLGLLRFPLGFFSHTAPGEVIPIITSEVEPLGGFIGDSFAVPALQGGTLLNILLFMCIQDPILALAAIALYPVQIYFIPKLQAKVNQLSKQRVRMVRSMADRINESALALQEISAHGVAKFQLAEFSSRLAKNYYLRYDISQADVVTLYLLTSSNERLKPELERYLKPTARVVSHDYEIRGWKPETVSHMVVEGRPHVVYVYRMSTR